MLKLLSPVVLAFTFPMGVVAQAAQSPCTPPGVNGDQLLAITRIGVGGPYTITAVIKADAVTSKGVKTIGGVIASFQARDSKGRTRVDVPGGCFLVAGQPRWTGSISLKDPVANTFTTWQVEAILPRKVAFVRSGGGEQVDPLTTQEEFDMERRLSQASDHDTDAKSHIQHKVEDLGKRTIAGLEASGMRITKTFPAGLLNNTSAAGLPVNKRPFTEVDERWTSDQYRLILMDITDNEATGKSSYEVTNFTLGEPDPSLFQPPPDYSVNNMAAK